MKYITHTLAGGLVLGALVAIVATGTGSAQAPPANVPGLHNSAMITQCTDLGAGSDCRNTTAVCDEAAQSYSQSMTVEATDQNNPDGIFSFSLRAIGIVEPKAYAGCTRVRGTVPPLKTSNAVNMLCTGGTPSLPSVYGVYELQVANNPPIPNQPSVIRFNSVPSIANESHYTYRIDESFNVLVRTGSVLTLYQSDPNCRSIMNCGVSVQNYQPSLCRPNARTVPGAVLPSFYRGQTYNPNSNGPAQPFQAQFVSLQVLNVTLVP
jgi:hypothetical protein